MSFFNLLQYVKCLAYFGCGSNFYWFHLIIKGRLVGPRRIPLMQNFFEKSLADTENIISPYLAYGLKELAIFFKPINILINWLQSHIGQAKAFHSVCPNDRWRHVRWRNHRLLKCKKWPFLFIYLLLRDEVWTYSNQLAMFLDRLSIDPPSQIFYFHPSQNSRGDWIGPSNWHWIRFFSQTN